MVESGSRSAIARVLVVGVIVGTGTFDGQVVIAPSAVRKVEVVNARVRQCESE
jgi:hypothetical protein